MAAALTTRTRGDMIAACTPVVVAVAAAARTATAASTVTDATTMMETAPLPLSGTEARITGIATTRAQTSTRVTAAATTPATEASPAEVRRSPASCRVSSASLPLLLLCPEGCRPCYLSRSQHSKRSWASWGNRRTLLLLHPLLRAFHLPGSRIMSRKHCVYFCSKGHFNFTVNSFSQRGDVKKCLAKEERASIFVAHFLLN